jgi:hypothetical protein
LLPRAAVIATPLAWLSIAGAAVIMTAATNATLSTRIFFIVSSFSPTWSLAQFSADLIFCSHSLTPDYWRWIRRRHQVNKNVSQRNYP